VQYGAAEAIQPGHHQDVPVAEDLQDEVQFRPGGFGAAGVIDGDVVPGDAGSQQGIGLVVWVLLGGGDPARTRPASVDDNLGAGLFDVVSRHELPMVITGADIDQSASVGK